MRESVAVGESLTGHIPTNDYRQIWSEERSPCWIGVVQYLRSHVRTCVICFQFAFQLHFAAAKSDGFRWDPQPLEGVNTAENDIFENAELHK